MATSDLVDTLWPRRAAMIPEYEDWLERARVLIDHRTLHDQSLRQVGQEASLALGLPLEEARSALVSGAGVDAKLRFRFEMLAELVELIDVRIEPEIPRIEERRDFAGQIRATTVDSHREAWDAAIEDIAHSEMYGGLQLRPQVGLVPLDLDMKSGLWEFWHVESGERPERDPESGSLGVGDRTGIVLVLIPGGAFEMGAQRDPNGPNFDPVAEDDEGPVHEVHLEPFFISKYEMTQGQWLQVAGTNPSYWTTQHWITEYPLRHPVESVSWAECRRTLDRVGLMLPTEARWEYATRAGTRAPWWTGSVRQSLNGAANLGDVTLSREMIDVRRWEPWLDDAHAVTAPVGSFAPNPFGLHDVAGNVFEHCLDMYASYKHEVRDGDGLRLVSAGYETSRRIQRGGSYIDVATLARSSMRSGSSEDFRGNLAGVRPARNLDADFE